MCYSEKAMATHSSVLAWRTPGTGEPGGLPSMGSHRVGHDWSDLAAAAVNVLLQLTLLIPQQYYEPQSLRTLLKVCLVGSEPALSHLAVLPDSMRDTMGAGKEGIFLRD